MTRVDTDSQLSIEAGEFLWSQQGLGPSHRYLLPAVVNALRQCNARTVLDLGCGNGAVSAALARAGFDVTGIDSSETGLAIARRQHPGISFIHSSVEDPLPRDLQKSFDA